MKIKIEIKKKQFSVDLSKGVDLSFSLQHGSQNPKCFYAPDPSFEPVRTVNFVGSTLEGSPVNFYNVFFNPHGNGTHTECVGHIAKEKYLINDCLTESFFIAKLITVVPKKLDNGDHIISKTILKKLLGKGKENTLIVRSNIYQTEKTRINFSGKNPIYFTPKALDYLRQSGVEHLLTDLPSVDREEDDGKLAAHKSFWGFPDKIRKNSTITELIFVPEGIKDGIYLLNIQVANFSLDAAPSRPVIYNLNTK